MILNGVGIGIKERFGSSTMNSWTGEKKAERKEEV